MARMSDEKYWKFLGFLALVIIISVAGSVIGLPLYLRLRRNSSANSPCHPCTCDCSLRSQVPSHIGKLLDGFYADCGGDDPAVREEMQKDLNTLLKEQLALMKTVAEDTSQRNEALIKDVQKSAEPYRKEAEKCRASVQTCEEAREKAEAEFILEKKRTAEWERQAHERGWRDPGRVYI